ncbi:MAG: deoxyribonuclease IV [Anaerovoracaceae bacterium]
MINIGCHLSTTKGFANMAKEALGINANTFAFFTRNPRGGKSKDIDPEDLRVFLELIEANNFARLVAHAPYTLNPCSAKEEVREFAHLAMEEDIAKMEKIPGNYYNFHPGSHTGQGREKGIELIVDLLNKIIKKDQSTVILLETMAGKGTEIGGSFEDLRDIISGVKYKDKIGVCMDSCHISDGGYDIQNNLDGVIEEFDRVVGIEFLKALHLNDSLNSLGAHKDRHAKIGEGFLGVETFRAIVNHPKLKELPMILETPNELPGYMEEIELLRGLEIE